MAYMRGPNYIYSTGDTMEIWARGEHFSIDMVVFDALAIMRLAQLAEKPEALQAAIEEALSYQGNMGADALLKLHGLPTAMDWVKHLLTIGAKRDDVQGAEPPD